MLGYFPLLLWVAVLSVAVGVYDVTLVQVCGGTSGCSGRLTVADSECQECRERPWRARCCCAFLPPLQRRRLTSAAALSLHASSHPAACCIPASPAAAVQNYHWPMLSVSSVQTFFSAITFALTLLLVFKTNSSYSRYEPLPGGV